MFIYPVFSINSGDTNRYICLYDKSAPSYALISGRCEESHTAF